MGPNRLMVALALLTGATSAGAQTRGDQPQLAASHYQTGSAEYREGHFREAAAEFRAAYELSHDAALLFNVGSALYDAGELPGARDAFEEYLRVLPNAANRVIVTARIESIRQRIAASTQPVRPAEVPATSTRPSTTPPTEAVTPVSAAATPVPVATHVEAQPTSAVAPLAVAGGGVLVLAAAGVFYGLRSGVVSQCADEPAAYYCPDAATANSVITYNALTNVALGVGGVLLVGGALWLILSRSRTTPPPRATLGATVSDVGGAIVVSGRF